MIDCPYKEYFPTEKEFQIIKTNNFSIYMTVWELVCHFHIYDNLLKAKNYYIWHKKWIECFFTNVDGKDIIGLKERPYVVKIEKMIAKQNVEDKLLSEDVGDFTESAIFWSYHRWDE